MEKLKINSGLKKIEVNDNGEYITVNLSDNTFFENFNNLMDWMDAKQVYIDEKEKVLQEKYADQNPGEINIKIITETAALYKEVCDEASAKLDGMFGYGCMKKVYPDVESPGFDLIIEFLDEVTPLLKKFAAERKQYINTKYNRNRKGARSHS